MMKHLYKLFIFTSVGVSTVGLICWKFYKGQRKRRNVFPGLLNVGNTCFMNSVLQCLASQSNFTTCLELLDEGDRKNLLVSTLCAIISRLQLISGESYFDPSDLLFDMMARGWHIPQDQHDAHEFFNALLSTIDDERKYNKEQSPLILITKPQLSSSTEKLLKQKENISYRGLLSVKLRCMSCGNVNPITYETFDCLSVPIATSLPWQLGPVPLLECLRTLIGKEQVSDVTCVNCSDKKIRAMSKNSQPEVYNEIPGKRLENRNLAKWFQFSFPKLQTQINLMRKSNNNNSTKIQCSFEKETYIAKIPQSLCIHLQRLVWKQGIPIKQHHFVEFPQTLDLQQYMSKYPQHVKAPCEFQYSARTQFSLTGVIVHIGAWGFQGHYVAYRKFASVNQTGNITYAWYFTSDTIVRRANIDEVLSCPAYMLFYERI